MKLGGNNIDKLYLGSTEVDRLYLGAQLVYSAMDADAKAYIDALGTLHAGEQSAIDTFVKTLKAEGIWSKKKAIYPLMGNTYAEHKWNLKDPRDLDAAFRLTNTANNVIHREGYVMAYDVNTQYLNTHLSLNTTMTQNSLNYSFWKSAHVAGDYTEMGTQTSDYSRRAAMQTGFGANFDVDIYRYQNQRASFLPPNYIGLFSGNKTATATQAYKDGVLLGQNVVTPIGTENADLTNPISLLGMNINNNGTVADVPIAGNEYKCFTIGDSLTATEILAEYNAWNTLFTTLDGLTPPATGNGVIYGTLIEDGGGSWSGTGLPANAFDSNPNTFYDALTQTGAWVGQDFGTARSVYQVRILPRTSFVTRLNGAQVQYSDNNSTWTTVATLTTASSGYNTLSFTASSHRYWRILFGTSSFGNCADIEFYN